MKFLVLDAFCGAGGAAKGYHDAGFDVIGVDIEPQPNYPYEFHVADALSFIGRHGDEFDLIHASPPCQQFTRYKRARPDLVSRYPNLIPETREQCHSLSKPFVIENVEGSPLLEPMTLCGSMFGLDVRRHRLFESNMFMLTPPCNHKAWPPNRYPGGRSREKGHARVLCRATVEIGRWNIPLAIQQAAMGGVDWMTLEELSESIPPVYTSFLGRNIIDTLKERQPHD